MRSNRRRQNVLPVASLLTWIILAVFACGAGLYYVYCKNQLHAGGAKIRQLEQELTELRNQNEVVQAQIDKRSSPYELRKRREQDKSFLAEYIEIPQDRLVLVDERGAVPYSAAPELRPVANVKP